MKRRRKGKKKHAIVTHAKKRMWERTGTKLTKAIHAEIINKIQNGRATLVERQSDNVGIYEVDGVHLVYDKTRKLIITVLHRDEDYIDPWLREKYMGS